MKVDFSVMYRLDRQEREVLKETFEPWCDTQLKVFPTVVTAELLEELLGIFETTVTAQNKEAKTTKETIANFHENALFPGMQGGEKFILNAIDEAIAKREEDYAIFKKHALAYISEMKQCDDQLERLSDRYPHE